VCDGCQDVYEDPSEWPCDTALWIAEADRLAERVKELESLLREAAPVMAIAGECVQAVLNMARNKTPALGAMAELAIWNDKRKAALILPAHQEEGWP
jgi:hypothetical protein